MRESLLQLRMCPQLRKIYVAEIHGTLTGIDDVLYQNIDRDVNCWIVLIISSQVDGFSISAWLESCWYFRDQLVSLARSRCLE